MQPPETTAPLGADALLLDDLLALLDDETDVVYPSSTSPTSGHSSGTASPSTASPAPPAKAKPLYRKRPMKHTLDGLRVETQQLTTQLEVLRRHTIVTGDRAVASAQEAALTARFKRRKAEHARQQLRDALAASALFLHGLQTSVLSAPPSFATGANLCLQLHNYTRLPSDRTLRWHELATMGHELQLRRAMDIVERETRVLTSGDNPTDDLDDSMFTPRVRVHSSSSRNGFCVTTTSAFAVDTKDVSAVLRAACVAVVASVTACRSYACTTAKQLTSDIEVSSIVPTMFYRVMGVQQQSRSHDDQALVLESRTVTWYKQTNDFAILLWDYIDDDALNPTDSATDINRQTIGAYLIRREMCDDGVERCVCRSMNTRRYHFLPRCSLASLERYEAASAPRDYELLVHRLLVDAFKKEESARTR